MISIMVPQFIQQSRMTKKIHPNASFKGSTITSNLSVSVPKPNIEPTRDTLGYASTSGKDASVALTVWRKSLLLNCKGFTVYDGTGNIIFRVDNYVTANRGEIVLMDAHGKALLTIRRKRLSWGDNWQIFEGETTINPRLLVQKQGKTKTMSLAQVQAIRTSSKEKNNRDESITYHIEGSYGQRNVRMYNKKRQCVAEIKKKEAKNGVALGGDVFKLIIVRPNDIDSALAMAFVILLDQMFSSS